MESQSIADSVRCQQYCDLTQGCLYWTWYRRHCDVLPCLEDHLTKINVCYLLSSCRLAGQRCSGCTSGSRVSEGERERYLILDQPLTFSRQTNNLVSAERKQGSQLKLSSNMLEMNCEREWEPLVLIIPVENLYFLHQYYNYNLEIIIAEIKYKSKI